MIALLTILIALQGAAPSVAPLERVPPIYPALGMMNSVEAVCAATYNILPDGTPSDVCVACNTSVPSHVPTSVSEYVTGLFVAQAQRAVAQWRFESSEAGQDNVTTIVDFRLQNFDGSEPEHAEIPAPETTICDGTPIT